MPRADVPALTASLQRLLNDADRRTQMGQEGRTRAQQFGWAALATRYLDVCEGVRISSVERRNPAAMRSMGRLTKEPRV